LDLLRLGEEGELARAGRGVDRAPCDRGRAREGAGDDEGSAESAELAEPAVPRRVHSFWKHPHSPPCIRGSCVVAISIPLNADIAYRIEMCHIRASHPS